MKNEEKHQIIAYNKNLANLIVRKLMNLQFMIVVLELGKEI
jgi:hypothetical protein